MKSQLKKLTAIFLSICVVLSLTSIISFAAETKTYTFSSYTAGTQYAKNEVHELDSNLTVVTNNCHFTSELRIYSNNTNNGYAVLKTAANKCFSGLKFNAGNKVDTLNVYGSNDNGASWTLIQGVSITATSYNDYTVNFNSKQYAQIKLDVSGSNQVRLKTITPTFETVVLKEYNVTYVVPNGETAPATEKASVVTLPNAELTGEYAKEYTFVGWSKTEVADKSTDVDLIEAGKDVVLERDTTFYAVYKYSEKSEEGSNVVSFVSKNIGDIKATDVVVVTMTSTSGTYAMSNNNGTGNPPAATKITIANNAIDGEVADTIKWNIGGNATSGYIFYPNGKTTTWLYCTSTNNGVCVGSNTNKTFKIDAGSGYLVHSGTNRFLGVYNSQDWRCYTSVNSNIQNQTLGFYVETKGGDTVYYTSTLESNAPASAIKGANIEVGTDLTANFYADVTKLTDPKMTFALGTEEAGDPVGVATDANGSYFAFEGIPPHYMTETITATLYDGDKVVTTLTKTIKDIAMAYLNGDYAAEVKTFAANMLNYGAASQNYMNKNTDKLANSDVDGYGTTNAPDASVAEGIGLSNNAGYFKSANVWFDNKNNIIVKFQNLPENAKLIVKKDGVQEFSGLASESYKTNDLLATELDAIYTFTIQDAEGEELQSLTYSVNYYTYAKRNSSSMGALAIALYNYGASAELVK